MSNIEKYSNIKKELLSGEFYFQSFLEEAYNQDELSDLEMENIQLQCIKLLADNTERYNKGESSSVRVDVAQSIMESNLFSIGIFLKSLSGIPPVLDNLKNEPISKLYQQGRRLINTKVNIARQLYMCVCKTKIQSPNYAYNATIERINDFFKQYNADFEAHEIPADIDYQLINPVTDLAGVEFIIQYLQNLYMENNFCLIFDHSIIHEVMCGHDENYKDMLENIFGQVLQNALGCTLLNKDILSLNIESSDINQIKELFKNKNQDSIYNILVQSTNELIKVLSITSESLIRYINESLSEFAARIHFAVDNNTLHKFFVPRYKRNIGQVIKYSIGSKMEDEAYRNIVNEVFACRFSNDKIKIIREKIRTLADMEDIIMDCELNETEVFSIFNMLDEVEVAVLVKRHPYHREIGAVDYSEPETQLQQYLGNYLQSMPKERQEQIRETMERLEII